MVVVGPVVLDGDGKMGKEHGARKCCAWRSMKKGGGMTSGCLCTSGVGDDDDGCALAEIDREGEGHGDRGRWHGGCLDNMRKEKKQGLAGLECLANGWVEMSGSARRDLQRGLRKRGVVRW